MFCCLKPPHLHLHNRKRVKKINHASKHFHFLENSVLGIKILFDREFQIGLVLDGETLFLRNTAWSTEAPSSPSLAITVKCGRIV